LAFSGYHADVKRVLPGFDECGNVCGSQNLENTLDNCQHLDMRNKPKLRFYYNKTCVEKCDSDDSEIFSICFKLNRTKTEQETAIFSELTLTYPHMLAASGLAFILSYLLLLAFRHFIDAIIWFTCGAMLTLLTILTVLSWMWVSKYSENMFVAIMFTIITPVTALVMFMLRHRFKLVGQLFKEASKALSHIPMTMFQPLLVRYSLS
jgi:hypothetical protein